MSLYWRGNLTCCSCGWNSALYCGLLWVQGASINVMGFSMPILEQPACYDMLSNNDSASYDWWRHIFLSLWWKISSQIFICVGRVNQYLRFEMKNFYEPCRDFWKGHLFKSNHLDGSFWFDRNCIELVSTGLSINAEVGTRSLWILKTEVVRSSETSVNFHYVGSEILTAMVTKNSIFWNITSRRLLKVNRRFGGTYHPHLQGRRISQERNRCESWWKAKLEVTFSS
jgi:hypothetical protein